MRQRQEINENADAVALRQGLGVVPVKDQLVQEQQETVSFHQVAGLKQGSQKGADDEARMSTRYK